MRRADRLFQIVQLLRSGRLTTARDLADRLEVSERTIYRDIAHLIGAGLPIDGAAGLGYLMRSGYDLPPLMFSPEEILALTAGARMVQAWGGADMARGADDALAKIRTILPDALRDRADRVPIHVIPRAQMTQGLRATLDRIHHAIAGQERLRIGYIDEAGSQTTRIIRPLGLWYWGMVWTLVAWCELRENFRMFRADRLIGATSQGTYTPEPGQGLEDFYALEGAHDRPDQPAG